MDSVAGALAQLGRCPEARPLLATAVAGLERALGPRNLKVADPLVTGARCDLAEGHAVAAVARLERAVAIAEGAKVAPADIGGARWLLARALWAAGRRGDAMAAARRAESELAHDPESRREHAAARAWLLARAR